MARTKNPNRRAAQPTEAERRAVKRSKASEAQRHAPAMDTTPSYFAALPREILGKVLALTGNPAKFASVCKAWNDCLRDSTGSGVWEKVSLYGSKSSAPVVPQHGGHLSSWLRQRVPAIRDMTFVRFRDHQHFISNALGLLSFAPLQRLSFEHCLLDSQVLPALRVTTGVTQLRLASVAHPLGVDTLLQALSSLPLLQDLEIQHDDTGRSRYLAWVPAVAVCTHLTSLIISQTDLSLDCQLPSSIGDLVKLESLVVAGLVLTALPASISKLTRLTALLNSVPTVHVTPSATLVIPAEAASMTALRELEVVSTAVPTHLGQFTGLVDLTVGRLLNWNAATAAQLRAAVASMQMLQRLRLHNGTMSFNHDITDNGLMCDLGSVLAKLPQLKELRLDGNRLGALEDGALGPHAYGLRTIDLGGNDFRQVPTELQRASGCRHLTLTLASDTLTRTYGSREEPPHSPLLSMPRLRSLALLQATWDSPDVEAVLDLRQAFDAARRGRGRKVVITCPRAVHRPGPLPADPEWDHVDGMTTDEDDYWDGDPYQDDGYNDPYDDGYFSDDYPPPIY